ncbi:MAG: helix-turn-helix transcriptional regulator [Lentisphaeria bacterium]|nr:helix-turn-helix transcriptional regulator [Lentisphaeria bacterium]
MDIAFNHLNYYRRKIQLLPSISCIGFLKNKEYRIKRVFNSCNFSFILRGSGTYLFKNKYIKVEAPCILIQTPEIYMDYGPNTSWDEIYFIYLKEDYNILQKSGLLQSDRPIWQMKNANKIVEIGLELKQLLSQTQIDVDTIDLRCYEMLLKSHQEDLKNILSQTHITEIRNKIAESIGGEINISQLATKFHMSKSTFKRYWHKYHGEETFMEYRDSLIIAQSSKLLIESDLSVKEIANKLNFKDPFYFSRKFHKLTGTTPIEYRKKNRIFTLNTRE